MKDLTEHQKELLREVRKGKTYKKIADERGVSTVTIRNTMSRIMESMDAKNKVEAIRHAEMCGQLEADLQWAPPKEQQ